jgi:hypothetical protein
VGNEGLFGTWLGDFGTLGVVFAVVFVVVAVFVVGVIVTVVVKGLTQWSRNNGSPLTTVEATVVTKRPHTWGGSGESGASTTYYATFETPTGERVELPVSGAQYGQLAEGDRGTLVHQGTRFREFARTSTTAR